MTPTLTVFARSPDRGRGLARDMPVRWALEEVGRAYEVRLVTFETMKEPAHRARNPFGQIPTYEEGDLVLFESGAIVQHIAEHEGGLLPLETGARARAIMWMFAAVNTVEPPIFDRSIAPMVERGAAGLAERLARLDAAIGKKLSDLACHLGEAEWLDGGFSAGDLMMITVLRRVDADVLAAWPNLAAYVARGEARPAFRRAFEAQAAVFATRKVQTGVP